MKLIKFLFHTYHGLFPQAVATCRFRPTCSQYALEAFQKYGFVKGIQLALARVLTCHPFSKRPFYDPIPSHEPL